MHQRLDDLFRQIVGNDDERILKSGVIQPLADHPWQVGEVAAVDPDADGVSLFLLLEADDDCVFDSAAEGVVGVDQKDSGSGIELGICSERFKFRIKRHHP